MSSDNRKMITQIQCFTASSISMLNLLRTACTRMHDNKLSEKDLRSRDRFMNFSQNFINQMKDPEDDFDVPKFIRKAFGTLRIEKHCEFLKEKNIKLFEVRDGNNKIMTILPGLDLRIGYACLHEDEVVLFWQYMYLFASSVFHLIKDANEAAFEKKYMHINDVLKIIETDISKTGVSFNNQIFNPFIGVGDDAEKYSVNEMFTGGTLPKQQSVSIGSIISMLGVDKLFDEKKLQEELKDFTEQRATEATDKIIGILGANDNPEVREVCNTLIKDLVGNFKESGFTNMGDTLAKVAEKAKGSIEPDKMMKTAKSVKNFMYNSKESMKDMKDANGNPIGQQLIDSMAIPLSMMKFMTQTPGKQMNEHIDEHIDETY